MTAPPWLPAAIGVPQILAAVRWHGTQAAGWVAGCTLLSDPGSGSVSSLARACLLVEGSDRRGPERQRMTRRRRAPGAGGRRAKDIDITEQAAGAISHGCVIIERNHATARGL